MAIAIKGNSEKKADEKKAPSKGLSAYNLRAINGCSQKCAPPAPPVYIGCYH